MRLLRIADDIVQNVSHECKRGAGIACRGGVCSWVNNLFSFHPLSRANKIVFDISAIRSKAKRRELILSQYVTGMINFV